jgi:hypothetical protein
MAEETGFLVEPPAGNQVVVAVGLPEGAEMTPEMKARIEALISSLMASDMAETPADIMCGGAYARCSPFSCTLDECKPLKKTPTCLAYVSCRIDL